MKRPDGVTIIAVWKFLSVRCRVFELTNERLRHYEGVLNQDIDEIDEDTYITYTIDLSRGEYAVVAEGEPPLFMEKLLNGAHFENARVATIDGLRVEFERGWGLVRASNTTPCLVLRFEADDELALSSIQDEFRRVMLQADPSLSLPF